jgi:glycerol-3-phosphate acyltransferase PlsX
MPSVIALDAMGSDRAPKPEIEGAIQAARQYGVRVLLVGPETIVKAELDRHSSARHLPIEIVHASEYITMDDKVEAIRAKRDNSMRVGLRLVREGQAHGFVTAGNTGAAMATAKIVLGGVPGVDRPALAAVFPTAPGNPAMLLDVGANVDCTAQNLEQFAVMGDIYFRAMFGRKAAPRVGLLSIGEEETKGNDLTREAFQLLKQLSLNFVGNVEGRDLYNGKVDVIVADGFVGNVALKISEGVANLVRTALRESLKATITRQVGALLSRSAFTDFKKRLDHTEYGGAPLLGVKGVCIITHGSSNANAMKNAVRVAAEFSRRGVNQSIERGLAALHPAAREEVTQSN